MKFSEKWLREWVNPKMDMVELSHQLTMIGHEVNSIELQGTKLDDVVIAEIISVDPHPNADRLSICHVSTGKGKPIKLVCGAPNVRSGIYVPVAKVGATLNNGDFKIKQTLLNGISKGKNLSVYLNHDEYMIVLEAYYTWIADTDLPKGLKVSLGQYVKMLVLKDAE